MNFLNSARITIFQGDYSGTCKEQSKGRYQSLDEISDKYGLNGHVRLTMIAETNSDGEIYRYDNGEWELQGTTKGWG